VAKRQSGLGADAIFGSPEPPKATVQPTEPVKADGVRTTIMLPPDVVVLLNRLKEQSILAGNRQTQGEIIADAIRTLARLKEIKT
jgi:hypothetical protein